MKNASYLLFASLVINGLLFSNFFVKKNESNIKDSSVTLQEIQKLDKLVTAKLITQGVVPYERSNQQFGITVGRTSFIYISKGYALAGISLSKILPQDIVSDTEGTTVTLPKAEIFEINLDINKSEAMAYRKDWFGADEIGAIPEVQGVSLNQMANFVCSDSGILQSANAQAVIMLDLLYKKTKHPVTFKASPVDQKYCINSVNKALNKK